MGAGPIWIKVGPQGTFERSGTVATTPSDIDVLLGPALHNTKRLLIHVHGGLVNEASGLATADAMARHYGETARSIGLVWETGIWETVGQTLADVTQTRVFKKTLSWIIAKAMPGLGAGDGARGHGVDVTDASDIEARLDTEDDIEALDRALAKKVDEAAEAGARGSDDFSATEEELAEKFEFDIDELKVLLDSGAPGSEPILDQSEQGGQARGTGAGVALFLARVVIRVIGRYLEGTHHDPLPTAVEELLRAAYLAKIGGFAWSEMKDKAATMWRDDRPAPDKTARVGVYILRHLETLQAARPEVTIDLVGHSAGSIVICAMLDAIRTQARAIKLRNVLFLAPAVRLDTFRDAIPDSPAFTRFRLFTMTDAAEKADRLVGVLYPRSLLFLVSGLFEDRPGTALAGLARHITARTSAANDAFDQVRSWLGEQDRLVLSPSADGVAEGLRCRALKHGDFDNEPETLASLRYLAGSAA
jgi:hypothetical protein